MSELGVSLPASIGARRVEAPALGQRAARAALGVILLLAAYLYLFDVDRNGFANTYYAATVRSMSLSWHNFFFGSFDPGGFIGVDKPAPGFWLQTLSVKIFGFHPLSLLAPQALEGLAAIALLYVLVARVFGRPAGLIAALVLALTPVTVGLSRYNNPDPLMTLALLGAAWACVCAVERDSGRLLALAAALVGIAFNVKSFQAYVVVPALAAYYAAAAPASWSRRARQLAVAAAVLIVVSFAWPAAVQLAPATARPWIGDTNDNNEFTLIFSSNGLDRLLGTNSAGSSIGAPGGGSPPPAGASSDAGVPSGAGSPGAPTPPATGFGTGAPGPGGTAAAAAAPGVGPPPGAGTARPPGTGFVAPPRASRGRSGPGPSFGAGTPGPTRFLNEGLAGQVAWLLALAFAGAAAVWLVARGGRLRASRRRQALVLWGGWLGVCLVVFSATGGIFHPYYTSEMAPAIAGLVGAGVPALAALWRRGRRAALLAPIAVALSVVLEAYILAGAGGSNRWLEPTVIGFGSAGALLLVARHVWRTPRPAFAAGGVVALAALLLAPATWAFDTTTHAQNGGDPTGGPATAASFGGAPPPLRHRRVAGFGGDAVRTDPSRADPALERYLRTHRNGTRFLVATQDAQTAAPFIIDTGLPVMAVGGFLGTDRTLTPAAFERQVAQHRVRYFVAGVGGPLSAAPTLGLPGFPGATPPRATERFFRGARGPANAVTTWVERHCARVTPSSYAAGSGPVASGMTLYDCGR